MSDQGPEQAPPQQPAPVSDDDAIDAYLRQHMGHYTHQALDAQLRAAGHSDAAIAAAWLRVSGAGAPQPLPPAGAAGFLYLLAVIAIVFVYGGSALLAGFGALIFSTSAAPDQSSLVLGLYTLAVIVAGVVSYVFLSGVERRRRGVLRMLGAIAVVAVVYVGLSGLCFGGLAATRSL